MKKTALVLLAFFLILISFLSYKSSNLLHVSEQKEAAALQAPVRWIDTIAGETLYHLVLGDSVAKGYGSAEGGYAAIASRQLQEKLQKEVIVDNIAINGIASQELVSIVATKEVQDKIQQAHIITISIGGNNLLRLNPGKKNILEAWKAIHNERDVYKEDLHATLRTIRAQNPHAVIVLSELYNPVQFDESILSYVNVFLDGWNDSIYDAANEHAPAIVLPVRKLLPHKNRDLFFDKIHPNDTGYTMIADVFVELLMTYEL